MRRSVSDPIYCPAQTFAGRYYNDPEPPEYCEAEVENEGDYCPKHEVEDDYDPRWDE